MIARVGTAPEYDEESDGFGAPPEGLVGAEAPATPPAVKALAALTALGFLGLVIALSRSGAEQLLWTSSSAVAVVLGSAGALAASWSRHNSASNNDGVFFRSTHARGALGWALGVLMTGFYVVLYWFPSHLEAPTRLLDPLARTLAGRDADRWFLYGLVYTLAVLVFGVRMLVKHRHNRYQLWRTLSVMGFQLGFAFLLPHLMELARQPEFYFTYFWPLKWGYLFPSGVDELLSHPGGLGVFLLVWTAAASLLATPVLTYFYGKRWYCSWVCGCGGLAETLGDPFRQLSNKSSRAWRLERVTIYSVLALIVLTTAAVWLHAAGVAPWLGPIAGALNASYGFAIGAVFSGVVGVGFYPLLGSRVWCRFGCPMAALLGLQQRLWSRFRITTNGGQCMSCGNCSTYCEMGIDVRSYAQRGENIVRASCVGCGVCSAVCPRGVLRLENGSSHAARVSGPSDPWARLIADLRSRDTHGGPHESGPGGA